MWSCRESVAGSYRQWTVSMGSHQIQWYSPAACRSVCARSINKGSITRRQYEGRQLKATIHRFTTKRLCVCVSLGLKVAVKSAELHESVRSRLSPPEGILAMTNFFFFIWLVSNSQVRTADRDFTAWLRNTLKPTVRTTEFFKEYFWLVKLDWTNGTIWMTIFSFTINLLWNMQFSFFRTSLIMCTRHNAIHTLQH